MMKRQTASHLPGATADCNACSARTADKRWLRWMHLAAGRSLGVSGEQDSAFFMRAGGCPIIRHETFLDLFAVRTEPFFRL